jgi:hypothetical protein
MYAHVKRYHSADAFSDRSDWSVAFEMLWGLLPEWLITLTHYAPTARFRRLRSYMKASEEVAQALLSRQKASYLQGKEGSKDLMSLLSKSLPSHRACCKRTY